MSFMDDDVAHAVSVPRDSMFAKHTSEVYYGLRCSDVSAISGVILGNFFIDDESSIIAGERNAICSIMLEAS